jgi:D-amino peptidase
MMKLLISADMEGITGVTTWDQVTPGHPEYARFRRLMTADVNAAVRGAFAGGAGEVTISDAHWNGSNVLVDELDPRARLNSGTPSPLSMMQGIDKGVHGVVFVGYHARHGSANAILDHTWSSGAVQNLWLNDAVAGEYTLNAALAGHYGVPVLAASGDHTACSQISDLLPGLETAIVKRASSRYAAECLPPVVTADLIEQAVKSAAHRLNDGDAPRPYTLKTPIRVTVEFKASDMADRAQFLPGAARDGLRLSFEAGDMISAYGRFAALVELARSA